MVNSQHVGCAKIQMQQDLGMSDAVLSDASGVFDIHLETPIAANPVAAENGVAAVLIRSGLKPGAITVTASVEGLQPAGATVQSAPFVEYRSAQSYFEPLRVKVDLDGTGESRPIQGWTPLSVLGVPAVILEGQAEEARTFPELGGATVVLKKTTGRPNWRSSTRRRHCSQNGWHPDTSHMPFPDPEAYRW
jgi:hypothetical protein